MFRVVCIEDSDQEPSFGAPLLKKGNIYHVIEEVTLKENKVFYKAGIRWIAWKGLYYSLMEIIPDAIYEESMFVKINDDEIQSGELDETQIAIERITIDKLIENV